MNSLYVVSDLPSANSSPWRASRGLSSPSKCPRQGEKKSTLGVLYCEWSTDEIHYRYHSSRNPRKKDHLRTLQHQNMRD